MRVTRDGVLVIEGERKQEEEKEENGFKHFERVYGQFIRRFRLVRQLSNMLLDCIDRTDLYTDCECIASHCFYNNKDSIPSIGRVA